MSPYESLRSKLEVLRGRAEGSALEVLDGMLRDLDDLEGQRALLESRAAEARQVDRFDLERAYEEGVTEGYGRCFRQMVLRRVNVD